ncbi:Glycosyltransferase [Hexamita inflata]|uniref:Glycosyltransferase n=1 Tax=Hexamita inflata TaxID=28002 RepID=A0AA86PE67_9EUKA|nr:Glycosyltransferase [Hexamita inflata]
MPFTKLQSSTNAMQNLQRIQKQPEVINEVKTVSAKRSVSHIKAMTLPQMHNMQNTLKKHPEKAKIEQLAPIDAAPEEKLVNQIISPNEKSSTIPEGFTVLKFDQPQVCSVVQNPDIPSPKSMILDPVIDLENVVVPTEKETQFLNSLPRRPPKTVIPVPQNRNSIPIQVKQILSPSSMTGFKFQSETAQKLVQKKLRIRPSEIELEPQSKRLLSDFDDIRMKNTMHQLTHNIITLDVRRLQTALFVSQINANIGDSHKQQVGADLSSAWPHYLWLSLWGIILGAGITLLIVFSLMKSILNGLSVLFYIFISLEYTLMFAALKTGQYGTKVETGVEDTAKVKVGKVCIVIPVGWGIKGLTESQKDNKRKAKIDVLTNTLDAANLVFEATDIFVFHNSSEQELPDQIMMQCCANRSIYVPICIGSKSVSAYYGGMLGQYLGYEYVIVMDDDTRLPQGLTKILNGRLECDAYCMAIAASSNENPDQISQSAQILIGLQDIEYKLSDLNKLTQYNFTNTSSVLAPHGAINMWRTSILTDIMQEHNCIFHGEDYQMGLIMRNRHPKARLGIMSNIIVNTVAPSTLHDLYMQRYTSWDLAAQQFLWGGFCASQRSAHYMQVLFCLPCSVDNILIRVSTLEDLWTVLQDYLRVILFAYHIIMSIVYGYVNIGVLVMYLVVIASQWVIAFGLEYVKFSNRPDLQVNKNIKLKTVILFPIYRFCFSFVRVAALLRFFFKFESVKRNAQPIRQMNLPQPKELHFAFPGINNSQAKDQSVDLNLISEIVQSTLNAQKTQTRFKIGDLSSVMKQKTQAERSDRSRLSLQQVSVDQCIHDSMNTVKQMIKERSDINRERSDHK